MKLHFFLILEHCARKGIHFREKMHFLPQRLKSTFFDIFLSGVYPRVKKKFHKTLILVFRVIMQQPKLCYTITWKTKINVFWNFFFSLLKKMLILAFETNSALSGENGLFSTFKLIMLRVVSCTIFFCKVIFHLSLFQIELQKYYLKKYHK